MKPSELRLITGMQCYDIDTAERLLVALAGRSRRIPFSWYRRGRR